MGAIVFPETLISNSENPMIGLASHWGKLLLLKRRVILTDGPMPTTWLVTQEGGRLTTRNLLSEPTTGHTSDKQRSKKPQIKMGTINIGTIRHKKEELVEVMMERRLDILGLCETRLEPWSEDASQQLCTNLQWRSEPKTWSGNNALARVGRQSW